MAQGQKAAKHSCSDSQVSRQGAFLSIVSEQPFLMAQGQKAVTKSCSGTQISILGAYSQ
jgi:hypothetical protein